MLTLNFDAAVERDINMLAQLEGASIEQVLTEAFRLYCEAEKRENLELNQIVDARLQDGQSLVRVSFFWFPRAAWEPRPPALRAVFRGAARRNCIPTQRVGTRNEKINHLNGV